MKVLQVIDGLRSGGAEGFVTNLGTNLAALGADVRFFLTAGVRGERGQVLHQRLLDAGIDVIGVEQRKAASLANFRALYALVREWQPHVVQANLYSAEVLSAAIGKLPAGRRATYVRRLVDTNIQMHRSPWVLRRLDGCFATTIACSPAVAEAYSTFMDGKNRCEIATIPNGGKLLDAAPDDAARSDARRTLDIPGDAFVVAHIGRMSAPAGEDGLRRAQKAHDVLIQSFAEAIADAPNAVLLCMGDGPLRPTLEALATELRVADRVRFLGVVPEPWPALTAADVFCFPSRHEGMPNVLPEAASCGLPVVASDIKENRFLDPGDPWLFAPVDDVTAFASALKRMRAELPAYTARAAKAAADFREQFSMQVCAERYLTCYRESQVRMHGASASTGAR